MVPDLVGLVLGAKQSISQVPGGKYTGKLAGITRLIRLNPLSVLWIGVCAEEYIDDQQKLVRHFITPIDMGRINREILNHHL